ncbi:MAG TPA: lactonase family protein [Candidatus Acidoferrum sp.]|nr:lactonase family protein [Candidatus Acidoferrum sp.]
MVITRCFFLSLLALAAPLAGFSAAQNPHKKHAPQKQYLAYIGTYTTKTSSKGIYAYRFDGASGELNAIGLAAESSDPSFVAVHPSGKYLYAVNEGGNFEVGGSGAVSAFAIDGKSGKLTFLNQVATRGAGPCHLSLDKTGKYVLVANYDGGSVAVFPVLGDGSLGKASGFTQHTGSGPNKERQEGPHAHWIATSPDNRFALAVDLGLDEVLVYHFDASKGSLAPNDPPFAKVSPGAGPRHLAFPRNGQVAYVLSEIDSNVTVFAYEQSKGTLSALQTISTLPKDYAGLKEAAEIEIHPSGKFLYASNRGHDSIAVFTIDPAKGTLTSVGQFLTKGKTPRHFAIDPTGAFLLAANEESNNIVVFKINPATGDLTPTGQVVEAPSPVCITFVDAE